jgi:trk system potassium uptake protein TrkA
VFVLIVGIGRVGSSLARRMLEEGHEVSCVDEDPEALPRLEAGLGRGWVESGGSFTIGQALELDALLAAGIERAGVFVASTNGDNTNIVIAQIAEQRFEVPTVIARVLDPLRAEWYAEQGMRTICPTQAGIDLLTREVLDVAGGSDWGGGK